MRIDKSLPRTHLQHLAPYELPSRSAAQGDERLELDQNENFAGASERALVAARQACDRAARYPDPDATVLRRAIADLHDLEPERIVCARGAMELISLLATAYLEPGATSVTSELGYMYFRTATELAGARAIQAPEPDFIVDPDAVTASVSDSTRLVFVANPGNPTGSYLSKAALVNLRDALPVAAILVIDEAYAEFVEPDKYQACFDITDRGNAVVLRTFSKIYGLAGMRIGWGYFPAAIASLLRVVQQPNGVTAPSQAAATAAVENQLHVEALRGRTIATRDDFIESLRAIGLHPLPSQGNFVLLRFGSPAQASDADRHLRSDGIFVRGMSGYGLFDCLRITLGTEVQMQRVLGSLQHWVGAR